jgi:hypothetical protein
LTQADSRPRLTLRERVLRPGIDSPFDLISQASVGSVPGWFVVSTVVFGYTLLICVTLNAHLTLTGVDHQIESLLRNDRD